MGFRLSWSNCFWLILPLLLWNLLLGSHITDTRITSDAASPKWLLAAENISRILVFVFPALLSLPSRTNWQFVLPGNANWQFALQRTGVVIYIIGTLIYFASWLPLIFAPGSPWSNNSPGLLAPRVTPFLSFLGIAMIGNSWLYGLISATFILFHTWHGIQNF
jgi:hypothetical protein